MKLRRYVYKIVSITVAVSVIAVLMLNFDSIFSELHCNALTVSANKVEKTQLPSKLNFLDDDKTAFVNYCKDIYGADLPIKIDENVYKYYGAVNGYRVYRLQPTLIPYDSINNVTVIGGYDFESPCRYRPACSGIYVIGDDNVYTLTEAYKEGIVNISSVYKLYAKESS